MASETADEEGFVTARTLAHYARLTEAGAGIVFVEYTFVDRSGRSEPQQLGADRDEQIPGLAQIAARIRASGAIAGLQLTHSGAKTSRDLTQGGVLLGPSSIAVPVKGREMETPDPMTPREIQRLKQGFVEAATRAREAGFDLVELHAAHGYGLNQWLSGITNQRTDKWGGTTAARARLLFEIVEAIRSATPELLLSVRMPGQDFIEGGLEVEDTAWIARELEARGVDLLDVSSGIGGWRRPGDRSGEGYLVNEAALIQSQVRVPVIGVGGIQSGAFIDQALGEGRFSLAAVGRAILGDPAGWGAAHLRPE